MQAHRLQSVRLNALFSLATKTNVCHRPTSALGCAVRMRNVWSSSISDDSVTIRTRRSNTSTHSLQTNSRRECQLFSTISCINYAPSSKPFGVRSHYKATNNSLDELLFSQIQKATARAFSTVAPSHLLKALTADEISKVASTLKQYCGLVSSSVDDVAKNLRFVAISLKEPSKNEKSEYTESGKLPTRQAEVVTINPSTGIASEYIVNVVNCDVVTHKELASGVQPMFTPDDCDLAETIVRKSSEVAAIIKERYGITDMERIVCDPWSINLACDKDVELTRWNKNKPGRMVQTFLYYRANGKDLECNHYAHPIDIVPVVDLNEQKVVTINGVDRQPPPSIPSLAVNYHRNLIHENSYLETKWRSDVAKELNVVQPNGPSFQVNSDNVVTWQKWSIQVGFNYREGIVLHNISFDGRPVVNRASLVEMAVPYADIHEPFQRKCAFDVGDYGLGYCANSLELGYV